MFLSVVNIIAVTYLCVTEIRVYGFNKKTFKKVKIWLLIFMLIMYSIFLVRMTFVIEFIGNELYNVLIYLVFLTRQLVLILIFEYFIQRCQKLVGDKAKKWRKALLITTLVALIILSTFVIYGIVKAANSKRYD